MSWTEPNRVRDFMIRYPLVMAFGFSLFFHLVVFGGWKLGKQLGWWQHQATWLQRILQHKRVMADLADRQKILAHQTREIPLTFIEVDPAVAVAEAPPDAKYYSAVSSKAANPDPVMESAVPKVDGQQTRVPRLADVPKPAPQPLQPALPPESQDPPAEPKQKGGEPPGDLAKAKPEALAKPSDGIAELGSDQTPAPVRERPRTLAAARQQQGMLAGAKMRQEGGVRPRGKLTFDVKATPFGSYDAALIAAVQERWYQLLDNTHYTPRAGKVVLEFRLYYDGRITDMRMNGNDVGDILGLICQRAVLDPAPYAPWPSDMRSAVAKNFREVTFTFYYN